MKMHALAAVAFCVASGQATADDLRWATLHNARFGSSIEFPSGLFTDFDPPRDGSGAMLFRTSDGSAYVYLSGVSRSNMVEPHLALQDRVAAADGAVDYARATSSFYALSRINRGAVHYTRCNYSARADVACFEISYPQVEAKWWDPVVTRMSRSLKSSP